MLRQAFCLKMWEATSECERPLLDLEPWLSLSSCGKEPLYPPQGAVGGEARPLSLNSSTPSPAFIIPRAPGGGPCCVRHLEVPD